MVWYSTWATSGALPALAAVSSLVISGSPATVSVAVTWMPGCEAFHTAVTLVMLGTQDQKVRLILPDDVDDVDEDGELQPAAASAVAATTTRVAATVLRPKDSLIAPPVPVAVAARVCGTVAAYRGCERSQPEAVGRHLRLRLARPGDRAAARRGHPGRPRDPDRGAAGLVPARLPGGPAGDRRGARARRRLPAVVLPEQPRLRAGLGADRGAAGHPVRPASGAGPVARAQRVRLSRARLLLRSIGPRVPRLAPRALRHPRRPERRVGNRLLGPALRDVGRDRRAAARPDHGQPRAPARLHAVLLRRVPGLLHPGARCLAPALPGHPGHHQLHGQLVQEHRLLALGPRSGRGVQRPLPGGRTAGQPHRPGDGRGPDPVAGRRGPLAPHGALHRRGELAAAQHRQAAGGDAPQQP